MTQPAPSTTDWVRDMRRRRQSRWIALLAGGTGLVLLCLALPRLAGEGLVVEARQHILALRTDPAATGGMTALLSSAAVIDQAGPLTSDGRLVADGGLLLLRAALLQTDAAQRQQLLRRAAAASEAGLRQTPAYPAAWTRLAFIRRELGEPMAAAAALRMSLLTGAVMPQVMVDRLGLGLDLLPYLDPEGVALLQRQIRLIKDIQPDSLPGLAVRSAFAQAFIEATLQE
ncbi:hypothetical protein CHU95_02160 [Niveispirillum lacus]|uniref:Uncharacterized protein n=1 Tax=Niveispirillum lacus TaxID=1981099 RepID=A0A255Z6K4_9PROT|nr:hypothetical protein [Niveispirillum lacus]OYQ37173.1 hypothetical protein CHU95_02160 [Niveispirillum lacus]